MKAKNICTSCGGARFSKVSDGSLVCTSCQKVFKRKNQFGTEFNTAINMKNMVRFSTIQESKKGEESMRNKTIGNQESSGSAPEDNWTETLYLFQILLTMNVKSVSEHLRDKRGFLKISEEEINGFEAKVKNIWFRYLEVWQKSGRPLVSCFTFQTGGKYNGAFNLVTKSRATLIQVRPSNWKSLRF
jgi:uncharacterized Zn finger protein (UPF0148 family)